jgi:phosphatidylserine/phosphatidylglycerophosphate/cardiolipin synthase-like enzyme
VFPLVAPVTGTCRVVELAAPVPALPDVTSIVELGPLPFGPARTLRRLPGMPTFYLAAVTATPAPLDDDLLAAGTVVAQASAAFVGLLFDDRVTLSPAAWVDQIAQAMTGVEDQSDVDAWRTLDRFAPAGRTLRVLDHVGRPAAGLRIRLAGAGAPTVGSTDGDGVLPLAPGELELTWEADGSGTSARAPVHALYEAGLAAPADRATSTRPGEPLRLPAPLQHGHLQLLDAGRWFADRAPQLDPGLARVHSDCRLEPLVDGLATFRPLLADLRGATAAGDGAHFAGWAFNDFPLNPAQPEQTLLTELIRALDGGAGARFLIDKFLVFRADAPVDDLLRTVLLLLIAGNEVVRLLSILDKVETDRLGSALLNVLPVLAAALASMILAGTLGSLGSLEDLADYSEELAAALEAIAGGIAVRARHPARFVDSALALPNPLPLDPADYVDGTGSWHQKFQVLRRTPDELGNRVVGYLGGIDMNVNRLDSPGHHGRRWRPPQQLAATPSAHAYHDVHARVTGPAAAEVALTFALRWAFDSARENRPAGAPPPRTDPAFPTPEPDDTGEVPPQPARHLVQIGRSGFLPNPAGGTDPLPWSPQGETTISDAILNAIGSAREYIYIEDQYFTPHDAYVRALLDASARRPGLRLLIVIPTESDQIFGDVRRRQLFERLRDGDDPPSGRGWGERMVVGAPVRRPVLPDAGRVAARYRVFLQAELTESGDKIVLGPRSRLPSDLPFWLWVQGERMLAVAREDEVLLDGVPGQQYLVRRPTSAEPLWESHPRAHGKGAPATLAQNFGIYVHTKAIMVDDVFVGIGSCNTNRRGFFHDGEIQAFAVPERLKAARDNPALSLRTALWAEHLGIPPAMGRALLADPIAAIELFRRPTVLGNRLSSFDALGVTPLLGFPDQQSTLVKMFAAFGLNVVEGLTTYVWNVFSDPTTASDPAPTLGPQLGEV